MKHNYQPVRCEDCGECEDLTYIRWEDRVLCASCFAKAVHEYALSYPFLLAEEMHLDTVDVPE